MASIQIFAVIADSGLRDELMPVLSRECPACLIDWQDPSEWEMLLLKVAESNGSVVLLEVAAVESRLADAMREIRGANSKVRVIALHPSADPGYILKAMRAGAHEFAHAPWSEHLKSTIDRVSVPGDFEDRHIRHGKVIGFLSAKGGCGATTLACHVAASLHEQTAKRVLLADLDLVTGMAGFIMKTRSEYSILDAVENLGRLDESLWKALVVETKPGLHVIPAPALFSHDQYPGGEELRQLVRFMRAHYDWVVLDLGRSLNTIVSELYEEIDQILLISVLEVTALHGLKIIIRRLTDCSQNLDRLLLVINRAPKTMEMSRDELARILGRPLYATLPNDYPSLYQSYSNGNLLAPNNRLAVELSGLAAKIADLRPRKAPKKFSLFG
ncbi:MAG TPA: AAA family ATPase [Bryobacteraceae bacterium]|jgi:pilus assembly protein CpaE|nr:AAA family ATPase [Bryobacteraceae bacterium]